MTKAAIYEKEYGDEDLKITSYYKKDYSSLNTWITLIWITAGYALLGGILFLCFGEALLEGITVMRLIFLAAVALALYLVLVILYGIGRKYSDLVEYYAGKYSLDEKMLYAVIRTESNFDPNAQSSVDARGLMQITEITFDWIKSNIAPGEELTFDDLYDPETNIRFGSYFFSYCLQRYGNDLATAAAAYHSGWGTVDELLQDSQYTDDGVTLTQFPYNQMNRYVSKVTSAYRRYCEIYGS